jgi:hypothetical protein
MLAPPWAHPLTDAKRKPTDGPKTGRYQRQHKMQGMVQMSPDKELLMPAPWAMCANFFFSHPAGKLLLGSYASPLSDKPELRS